MRVGIRRTAGLALLALLVGLFAGCGGGFSASAPSAPDREITSYAALGDGFTAAPYTGPTAADDGCLRSEVNYPSLVAEELDVEEVRDVSCYGATMASVTAQVTPPEGDSPVPPQREAVDADTDLVTIGLGLFERDLLPRVFDICLAAPCGKKVPPQMILSDVTTMAGSLTSAVREIQDLAPDSYIVLIGYPRIVPDASSCEDLPDVEQVDLDAANQVLEAINREIRSSARETGTGYLDVARLSVGHELCSADPWLEGRRGRRGESIAYHPVAAEQEAVAEALAALVRNH